MHHSLSPAPVYAPKSTFSLPYPHRCVCESDVGGELVTRLSVYPKMKEALASLPPKMLRLSSAAPPREITPTAGDLAERVSRVKERLGKATFTSPSDSELVQTACHRPTSSFTTALPLQMK